MATFNFYPSKKEGKCKVYVRASIKRGKDFRLSTTQTIDHASTWNYETNFPKKNTENNKNLNAALKGLATYLEDKISDIEKSTTESINDITSDKVRDMILERFCESPLIDMDMLIPFAKAYHEGLKNKTFMKNGVQHKFKEKTIYKYKNFARHLENFEIYCGKKIKIRDVDNNFATQFLAYLDKKLGLAINTQGEFITRLITIIKRAESEGSKINPNYKVIKSFEDENIVTFLTFDEIDAVSSATMPNERYQIVSDWLVVGCYTAQRISDLYRMRKEMIITEDGVRYISLKQYKTIKNVQIPIHYKVEKILKKYGDNFPPHLLENEDSNRATLAKLVKKVCEIAGIKETVRGRYNGVIGDYPKYKLIKNHTFRRSFACNFFGMEGWTVEMIMAITGHESHKSFYRYIDKENFYLSAQAAKNFANMEVRDLKEKEERELKEKEEQDLNEKEVHDLKEKGGCDLKDKEEQSLKEIREVKFSKN